MKRAILLCCLLSWTLLQSVPAAAQARLEKITRFDEQERIRLYCTFSALPTSELLRGGRRLDLIFKHTAAAAELSVPAADDHIVKILVRPEGEHLSFSLFFRYEPQEVKLVPQEQDSSLMLDILLGNQYSRAFPDLASQLHGLSLAPQDGKDSTNPLNLSRFQQDWRLLFERLETPLSLHPPPGYTLPPFPLLDLDRTGQGKISLVLPAPVLELAAAADWDGVLAGLRDALAVAGLDAETRELLLLSYAEGLLRAGKLKEAGEQLEQIRRTDAGKPGRLLSSYLLAQVLSRQADPHLARITLDEDEASKLTADHLLMPYLNILFAEISLATGQLDQATEALDRDEMAYTGAALQMRRLRRADISYLRGEQIRAFASYLRLAQQDDTIRRYPLSLAGYADALYRQHQHQDAARAYQELAALLVEDASHGLALFRQAMSELQRGDQRKARRILEQVLDGPPGDEASTRARLKIADLDYLAAAAPLFGLAGRYGELAQDGVTVPLREEALLKQALVFHQMGSRDKAVELAMRLLREFQHGRLRIDAQALLLQDLPEVLRSKVQAEEYIEALVLARQNRDLFASRWLDLSVLDENAEAYLKLGFPDRAIKVLQFLMETSPAHQTEQRYAKLIRTLIQAERYEMAEEYAERYMLRYPRGSELANIFLERLKALRQGGKTAAAAALLSGATRPRNHEIDQYGAEILFQLGQYQEAVSLLAPLELGSKDSDQQARFLLAESLYQLQRAPEALEQFLPLRGHDQYGDQALHRLGQIRHSLGQDDEAVNLWQELADKGRSPRWQRLAREELQLLGKKIR
ncbi:MAG: hypothetical protein BWK76_06860 [Desulfobulbaceae bacterium A2]|nr:MAG: hypothetical protein BWK76_06860 [Desulfobulbaceae bacterium A2]